MATWHIIEIILFTLLFIGVFGHRGAIGNLENRVEDLENRSADQEKNNIFEDED